MHDGIIAQAIEWHIRLRDGDDATWDGFADWLAVDSRHGEAYDTIEEADLAIETLLPEIVFRQAVNDTEEPERHRRRGWLAAGGALAASLVLAVTLSSRFRQDHYEVATSAGGHQIVTLDPGTRITLNGATRMEFDRKDARFASLIAGEALFHVAHDADRPFRLQVGDDVIEDAGTVFNVIRDPSALSVSVAEGRVIYNPGPHAVPLNPGQGLVARTADAVIRVETVARDSVGAWQRGQLIYAGQPLSQVAADLSRSLGTPIAVAPELAGRPFHGTIALDGDSPAQRRRLQFALAVTIEAGPDGWIMKPSHDGKR